MSASVELREITAENLDEVLALRVAAGQEHCVSTNAHSLAQAWVQRDAAYPFAVYADGVAVGFVMLGYYDAEQRYTLWKFMIDERFQGRGYGRAALHLAIEWLVDTFGVKEIGTGVAHGNEVAERLYRSVGFRRTGVSDEYAVGLLLTIE